MCWPRSAVPHVDDDVRLLRQVFRGSVVVGMRGRHADDPAWPAR
jgi:hypothetical protein